jgi:hypothetical protein|tara:strand:- start:229 stop:540 length:312 start_codon:yes stop_codon:yes gene_type:complete
MKIDKNIPIPKRNYGAVIPKYPWKHMEIGDSISIPIDADNKVIKKSYKAGQLCQKTVRAKSYFAGVTRGHPEYKFCHRVVKEDEGYALRIWRIEVSKTKENGA